MPLQVACRVLEVGLFWAAPARTSSRAIRHEILTAVTAQVNADSLDGLRLALGRPPVGGRLRDLLFTWHWFTYDVLEEHILMLVEQLLRWQKH